MLYEATRNFASSLRDGTDIIVREGELFDPDDEIVRQFQHAFRERPDLHRPDVEQATNEPGKRRGR